MKRSKFSEEQIVSPSAKPRGSDAGQGHPAGGPRKKSLTPTRKRALVRTVTAQFAIGVRRACGLLRLNRASWYYRHMGGTIPRFACGCGSWPKPACDLAISACTSCCDGKVEW